MVPSIGRMNSGGPSGPKDPFERSPWNADDFGGPADTNPGDDFGDLTVVTPPPQLVAPRIISSRRAPPSTPAAPAQGSTGGLAPTDIVGQFRPELTLRPRAFGGFEVADPSTGETYALNDLEVSLARMLDGRRQVSEVLAAGERLGIPINLESLLTFIHTLEEHGLLGPPLAAEHNGGEQAWPTRVRWESGLRTLFQTGIRLLRMGQADEAAGYFEAMLENDPDNTEARELLAIAQQASSHGSMQNMAAPGLISWPAPGTAQGATASAPPVAAAAPGPRARVPRWLRIALLVLAGAGGVILIYLLVRPGDSAAQPEARLATTGHEASAHRVADAGHAAVAATAASPDAAPAAVAATAASPDAAPVAVATAASPDAAPAGQVTTKSHAASAQKAERPHRAPVRVKARRAGRIRAFLRRPRRVRKGEKLFDIVRVTGDPAKIKSLESKVAGLEKLAKENAIYKEFLADARKQLASVRKVKTTHVVAPRAGVATARVKSGAKVDPGQVLAEIR